MARNCRFAIGVHVASLLALAGNAPVTSEWIAGSVNTNPVVVRRILAAFARAGITRNSRGVAGGSVLAREAAKISLKEIYLAVADTGGPALHHQPPNPDCPVGKNILPVLQDIMRRAEAAKEEELAGISVLDVLASVQQRQEQSCTA